MTFQKQYRFHLFFIGLLLFSLCLIFPTERSENASSPTVTSDFTVVIDAGHGGFDGGKVGIDGTLEKDINLNIAKKLKKLLKASKINVIMTRTSDRDLSTADRNQKTDDMLNRTKIMNDSSPHCVISIHQNSYPEEAIHGAQVFYHTGSKEGELLATLIQNQLIITADPENHRVQTPNDTYYLLKNVSAPIVIVECGFLSNYAESKKLADDSYQQTLAQAIHLGILQYFKTLENPNDPNPIEV